MEFIDDHFDDLRDDFLTHDDWAILRETYTFLQPFFIATKKTEGDRATLDRVQITMDYLIDHLKQAKIRYATNPQMNSSVLTAWFTFDKYYSMADDTPAYAAAMILHPSYKIQYIQNNWEPAWVTRAITSVRKLWKDEYQRPISVANEAVPKDSYDAFLRKAQASSTASTDELERYLASGPTQLTGNPLQWWLEVTQRQTFPNLSRMAIDLLSIPAMAAEPERVFSGARRTISWERARLGPERVEHGECLKSWIRSGVTKDGWIHSSGSGSGSGSGGSSSDLQRQQGQEEALLS